MGCGWGPFLAYAREIGADGVGLTLSEGQYHACINNGFEVYIRDCRSIGTDDFGKFNALVSVGAFEHFCSVQDYREGKQEKVYANFFEQAKDLLHPGDRFYLQTMVFGKNMIDLDQTDIHASRNSTAYIVALMMKEFPGSWLPYGSEMVEATARPWFRLISKSSGRLDYIETIGRWRKRFRKFNLKKYWLYLSLIPNYFTDREFRHRMAVFRISPNRICFEREVMDHYRFVFEKV